ncbi:hypothetical protein [Streptomyces boninensis]|uniref:hypothetical protein n=1 Tax=Streptomyces boninensis TaxID=2039455 RepID=UPI003B20F9ED
MSMPIPTFQPGEVRTRTEIRGELGGSPQGGICPSPSKEAVLLYSDRSSGERYGYRDGWLSEEDELGPIFEYTGQGRRGHQSFLGTYGSGNAAVLNHARNGHRLFLFTAEGRAPGSAAKTHRYIGSFKLDAAIPYDIREALDDDRQLRNVIVFRLRPIGTYDPSPADAIPLVHEPQTRFVRYAPESRPVAPVDFYAQRESSTDPAVIAAQLRADLTNELEADLYNRNHEVGRLQHTIDSMTTDLFYDADQNDIYEPVSSTARHAIQGALGQLLDISRQVVLPGRDEPVRLMVLSPGIPSPSVQQLLADHQIGLTFRNEDGSFTELQSGGRIRRSDGSTDFCTYCPALRAPE